MSALAEANDQLPSVVLGELGGLAALQTRHGGHRGGGAAAVDEDRVGWPGRLGGNKGGKGTRGAIVDAGSSVGGVEGVHGAKVCPAGGHERQDGPGDEVVPTSRPPHADCRMRKLPPQRKGNINILVSLGPEASRGPSGAATV